MSEPTPPTEALSIGALLDQTWREHLRSERQSGVQTRTYLYASGRQECVRRMALDLLHPEDREEFSDDSLERFERGKERERAFNARLIQLGPRCADPFEVIEGQRRFEVQDRDKTVLMAGKIDGRLSFRRRKSKPVYEVKSGQSVARVETLEDLDRGKWTANYVDQLLVYLLKADEPDGLMILDQPGVPRFLDVDLERHLDRAEKFLQEARISVDARFGNGPIPPFTQNLSLCESCPHFGKSCAPPIDFGEGLQVCTDPALVEAAEIRKANDAAATLYETADKELKAAFRGKKQVLVGPYIYRGKGQNNTTYPVPKRFREHFKKVEKDGKWVSSFELHGTTD